MSYLKKILFVKFSKLDYMCLLILGIITIIIRLIIIMKAPFIYAQDAYRYIDDARDFASSGMLPFGTGMTFVIVLGCFFKVLNPFFKEIFTARILVLFFSVTSVFSIYLIGWKFSGRVFGLLVAFFASIEPYFLKYSIVPYTEYFTITLALLCLFLINIEKKYVDILMLILIYILIFLRFEIYLSIFIPLLFMHLQRDIKLFMHHNKKNNIINKCIKICFYFLMYFLPLIGFIHYWSYIKPFNIINNFLIFFKLYIIKFTLNSIFSFYENNSLNLIICFFAGIGAFFMLLNYFEKYKLESKNTLKFKNIENKFFLNIIVKLSKHKKDSKPYLNILFFIFMFFIMNIIIITLLQINYDWNYYIPLSDINNLDVLRTAIKIKNKLHDRYLIVPRLLMNYPITYCIYFILKKSFLIKLRNLKFNKIILLLIIPICFLYVYHPFIMYNKGMTYSIDSSKSISTYVKTSDWLTSKLKNDEIAIVPAFEIFNVLKPELRENLIDFKSIWDSTGVMYHERSSQEKLQKLHYDFNELIKNSRVKYVVQDWSDPYAKYIFDQNYELYTLIRKVEEFPFILSTGWSDKIIIYQKIQNP
ncbi:MAG: hypothetical protein ACFFDN_02975 [Candidatus Hodarchaeota archaeon]